MSQLTGRIEKSLKKICTENCNRKPESSARKLHNDSGVIGAAAFAFHYG